jgi:hypothetical protein
VTLNKKGRVDEVERIPILRPRIEIEKLGIRVSDREIK